VGIETPLDIVSIASRDNWQNSKKKKTTLALNKGKRDHLNIEDLGLGKDFKSTRDKGKMLWI